MQLKFLFRKMDAERMKERDENSSEPSNSSATCLYTQKLHYEDLQKKYAASVIENESRIRELEKQVKSSVPENDYFVTAYFENKNCVAELRDKIICDRHSEFIANQLVERLEDREETIDEFVSLTDIFFRLLERDPALKKERKEQYENLRKRVAGKKTVAWRDDKRKKASVVQKHEVGKILKLPMYESLPRSPTKKEEVGLETVWNLTPPNMIPSTNRRGTFTKYS